MLVQQIAINHFIFICEKRYSLFLDVSGNPVTQSVVSVTDSNGNPVTGNKKSKQLNYYLLIIGVTEL